MIYFNSNRTITVLVFCFLFFFNEGKAELSRLMLDMAILACIIRYITVFTHGQGQCFIQWRLLLFWFGFIHNGACGMWHMLLSMCASDLYALNKINIFIKYEFDVHSLNWNEWKQLIHIRMLHVWVYMIKVGSNLQYCTSYKNLEFWLGNGWWVILVQSLNILVM